ncbi:hypothetical protein Q9L58_007484 [Maublancomyces gigas]|uniref:Biogenesis of lysosome-related organelles complex 1 subunit 7 n=1 Tax=Discina gigas TaxID=1032678 RepID=A0ABR3GCA3_9PEZI
MSSVPESNFNGGDDTVSPTPELSDIITPSRPTDPLAAGLKSLLDPTIKQTTEKLLLVHRSQQELNAELTRLISQLQHYLDTTDPPALKQTVVKLAATSKRLVAVNGRTSILTPMEHGDRLTLGPQPLSN